MRVKISAKKLNGEGVEKVKELSGQHLGSCYVCGNCSAGCPAADFMDLRPHQVLRLLQLGLIEEILESNTMWICAACATCTVRCPRGVDLARIMEALRQIILRDKNNHVDLNQIEAELRRALPQIALIGNFRKFTL